MSTREPYISIEHKREKEKYKISLDTRKFEIDLFWKRSLFFWGFIAATFVAYSSFKENPSKLALVVANFGMICSFAWTLVNRGSKYWQENWEQHVDELERKTIDPLFKDTKPQKTNTYFWLMSRQYSVSKIAIALSDYVTILWVCIVGYEAFSLFNLLGIKNAEDIKVLLLKLFTIFTFIYSLMIVFFAQSSNKEITKECKEKDSEKQQTEKLPIIYIDHVLLFTSIVISLFTLFFASNYLYVFIPIIFLMCTVIFHLLKKKKRKQKTILLELNNDPGYHPRQSS